MARKPAWRRKMTPVVRLEFDIQTAYQTIVKLYAMRYWVSQKWLDGNLRYWGNMLYTLMESWRILYGTKYRILYPVNLNMTGKAKGQSDPPKEGAI